jgi:hypothetical protein
MIKERLLETSYFCVSPNSRAVGKLTFRVLAGTGGGLPQ